MVVTLPSIKTESVRSFVVGFISIGRAHNHRHDIASFDFGTSDLNILSRLP
jgi:hypothetical protein